MLSNSNSNPNRMMIPSTLLAIAMMTFAVMLLPSSSSLYGGGGSSSQLQNLHSTDKQNINTHSDEQRKLLAVSTTEEYCTIQLDTILHEDSTDVEDEEMILCEMDKTSTHAGLLLEFDMDDSQTKEMKQMIKMNDLQPGKSMMNIKGMHINKKIRVPPGLLMKDKITKKKNNVKKMKKSNLKQLRSLQEVNYGTKIGDRKTLVVRVTDVNGKVIDNPTEMSDNVFGTYGDNVTLKSQIEGCSMNRTIIIPGGIPEHESLYSAPGVIDVNVTIDITNCDTFNKNTWANAAVNALQDKIGGGWTAPGGYDHILIAFENSAYYYDTNEPKCGGSWAAFATGNGWRSVYRYHFYKFVGVQVHELGHNFGFGHSGGLDGRAYSDHTGMMGNPLYKDDIGAMCYNAAKTWQIGWYNDRKMLLNPLDEASDWSTSFQMVGIANYQDETTSNLPVSVKIETNLVDDYFVAFNRATGVNSDNDEADDELTIVQVTGGDGESQSQSYLRATLLEGEEYTLVGVGGTDRNITVQHVSIDKTNSDGVWRANVMIGVEMQETPTNEPSSSPTHSPSESPTSEPLGMCLNGPNNGASCSDTAACECPSRNLLDHEEELTNQEDRKLQACKCQPSKNKWCCSSGLVCEELPTGSGACVAPSTTTIPVTTIGSTTTIPVTTIATTTSTTTTQQAVCLCDFGSIPTTTESPPATTESPPITTTTTLPPPQTTASSCAPAGYKCRDVPCCLNGCQTFGRRADRQCL